MVGKPIISNPSPVRVYDDYRRGAWFQIASGVVLNVENPNHQMEAGKINKLN